MNYALVGYGRMGRAVEASATSRGHTLLRIVDPSERGRRVRRRIEAEDLQGVQVAFEFTAPQSAEPNVIALLGAGVPVVCGTTGWDTESAALKRAARASRAGAVIAPNFSVGMHLFYGLVRDAARHFGSTEAYDPYVLESHHRGKADLPSGTASRLADIVVEEDPRRWSIQVGNPPGPLPPGTVHVVSLRVGHDPGTHVVGFDGEYDEIRLTHRSRGRAGFAAGAVLAAEWLSGRKGVHAFDRVVADLLSRGGRS